MNAEKIISAVVERGGVCGGVVCACAVGEGKETIPTTWTPRWRRFSEEGLAVAITLRHIHFILPEATFRVVGSL